MKKFHMKFLQVFQPTAQDEPVAIAQGGNHTITVSNNYAISFTAFSADTLTPVRYTLGEEFSATACSRASQRTIGIQEDVSHITFHADTAVDLYIERM